jgi:hypothetical protein
LELMNNRPFDSLSAINSAGISKSTVYKNLDTGKPVALRKLNLTVYFLSKEMSSEFKQKFNADLSKELLIKMRVKDNCKLITKV